MRATVVAIDEWLGHLSAEPWVVCSSPACIRVFVVATLTANISLLISLTVVKTVCCAPMLTTRPLIGYRGGNFLKEPVNMKMTSVKNVCFNSLFFLFLFCLEVFFT